MKHSATPIIERMIRSVVFFLFLIAFQPLFLSGPAGAGSIPPKNISSTGRLKFFQMHGISWEQASPEQKKQFVGTYRQWQKEQKKKEKESRRYHKEKQLRRKAYDREQREAAQRMRQAKRDRWKKEQEKRRQEQARREAIRDSQKRARDSIKKIRQ